MSRRDHDPFAPMDDPDLPDGVVPGETPGYPTDATTGKPLDLTPEEHADLAKRKLDKPKAPKRKPATKPKESKHVPK